MNGNVYGNALRYIVMRNILRHLYANFASFLLVTILNTLPELLLTLFQFIFSKISTSLQIFPGVTTRYHQCFKKNINILPL